jgi:cobalt-zinc-cadmium efflux system protein
MRAALLHMAGDALASLGVAVAGLVILLTGRFLWLDPAVSMAIGVLIAVEAFQLVRHAAEVLLESTPRDVNLDRLTATMSEVEGVETVHDLHVWSLSSEVRALSAHLVLAGHPSLEDAQVVGDRVKAAVAAPYAIAHSTLELECEPCTDAAGGPCGVGRDG